MLVACYGQKKSPQLGKISRIFSRVHLLNYDNCPKKKVKDEMYDRRGIVIFNKQDIDFRILCCYIAMVFSNAELQHTYDTMIFIFITTWSFINMRGGST